MDETKYDLTRGGILDKLLLVALPIIGSQLVMLSYNLVDTLLLGRLGSDAVAASGMAGMYMWLASGFMVIGRVGAEIGVAQNMGRREVKAAMKYSWNSMFLSLLAGLAIMAASVIFAEEMIGFFKIRERPVASAAKNYLVIVSFAAPGAFVGASVAGAFNGSGNSRVPFAINSASLVLNAALDVIFIFPLGMRVEGAALATAISQFVACAASLVALASWKGRPFERFDFFSGPERRVIAQVLRWGAPIGAESLLFTFFTMLISRFVASHGAGAIAVYRVGTEIESLCWLIGIGMSTAVAAFVGQNYGAGEWGRIRGCFRLALVSSCAWGVCVTALLVGAGGQIFGIFLRDPVLIGMGGAFLRIISACQILGCLEAVASGTFRGLGRTMPPSIASVASNAMRVPLAYALSQTALGLEGIWWGISLGAALRGLWAFLWCVAEFRRRRERAK
ncbi:MAG: MATE family efflux transporter [Synergistaceae bacterium]|jgi:putative MATE family efflux protein|nr:MATE family efflux transporter [Synergistaceae bacterium]